MNKGVIVIGAGHGGFNLASTLRTEKYEGSITLLSDEPDIPYHRPPLSKTFVKSGDNDTDLQKLWLRPEQFYHDNDIDLKLNTRVTSISPEAHCVKLKDGSELNYQHLVIATGTRARPLPLPGVDLKGVETLRTLADARHIKAAMTHSQNVVIIGGGFIGLEFAATANTMGKQVTVLEAAPRLLGRSVAPATSEYILNKHRANGIEIELNAKITELTGQQGHINAVLGQDAKSWPADLVIVGIGAIANDELAVEAGLNCDNGIVVDAQMKTTAQDIFAIGDCAAHENPFAENRRIRLESIQNATDQARIVARLLTGQDDVTYRSVPWFWSDQGDMKLQMVGLSFDANDFITRGDPESGKFSVFHYRGNQLIAIDSINHMQDHMAGRKLIAANISPDRSQIEDLSVPLKGLLE